jgi:hypothetical protein
VCAFLGCNPRYSLEQNMFQPKVVEKSEPHFLYTVNYFYIQQFVIVSWSYWRVLLDYPHSFCYWCASSPSLAWIIGHTLYFAKMGCMLLLRRWIKISSACIIFVQGWWARSFLLISSCQKLWNWGKKSRHIPSWLLLFARNLLIQVHEYYLLASWILWFIKL